MNLFDRFEIVDPFPALYDPVTDTVIIADLHLGLESLMAKAGTYMPKFQLDEIIEDLETVLGRVQPKHLVVCGDLKHEFSETSYGEWEEVQAFIEFAVECVDHILLVKGNHDNYLIYPVKDYDTVTLDDYIILDDICFIHGHESEDNLETLDADYLVIGHEHPALTLTDEVGIKEKLPAFLYGDTTDGRRIIVLPAFSNLADGSQVNEIPAEELLSPILQNKTDISTLKAVGVDRDAGLFEFPELGKLRSNVPRSK